MSNYLIHYSSPYYDPVKAHEYYMQHRQLKGPKYSSIRGTYQTNTGLNYAQQKDTRDQSEVDQEQEIPEKINDGMSKLRDKFKELNGNLENIRPADIKELKSLIKELRKEAKKANPIVGDQTPVVKPVKRTK